MPSILDICLEGIERVGKGKEREGLEEGKPTGHCLFQRKGHQGGGSGWEEAREATRPRQRGGAGLRREAGAGVGKHCPPHFSDNVTPNKHRT
jgi:hypothetical protein